MAVDKRLYIFVHPRRPFDRLVARLYRVAEAHTGRPARTAAWAADRLDDVGLILYRAAACRWARREERR